MTTVTNLLSSANSSLREVGDKLAKLTGLRDIVDGIKSSPRNIRVMRFALGLTIAVALTSFFNWPLSFLVPILLTIFLAMPAPKPPLKAGIASMLLTLLAFAIGLVFTLFLLPFPLIYVPMLGLVLFYLFYLLNRGGPLFFVIMALLAILILPMIGTIHESLEFTVAFGFVFSGWVTIMMVWIAHFLVPDQPGMVKLPEKAGFQSGYSKPAAQAALKSTIVILPIAAMFIMLELTDYILVLVFAAIFTLSPNVSKGKEAGMNSLKSTVLGGLYAFAFYALLIAVPEFHFFIALMFLTTLIFASNIFSDKPAAQYYASAFSTLYILIHSSLDGSAGFSSVFFIRFSLILLATIYVVFSLLVFDRYWPQGKENIEQNV